MRLLFFLSMLVSTCVSSAQTSACEGLLKTSPMAIGPLKKLSDGRWLAELDYSTEKSGIRSVEFPSALTDLKSQNNLRVIVLAGNSGTEYENTRHSLAHSFGDYMLRVFPNKTHRSQGHYVSRETVSVTYDDGTARSWTTDFRTQAPHYRTRSGEIFYFPVIDGTPALIIKMIGDYNEVGDFAVPILDALGLPANKLILIHDDLTLPEAQTQIASGVQKYNGNNALFSLIRSLAYGALPEVIQFLKTKASLSDEQWITYEQLFRAKANVRYAGHLGEERAFASAFKNVDSIMAALTSIVPAIEDQITTPMRVELQFIRARLAEAKRSLGAVMPELNHPSTHSERKMELSILRDQVLSTSKPLADQVKSLEQKIQSVRKDLIGGIRSIVEGRLTFARLSIGTDNGAIDRSDLPGYVLAPYPRDVFSDDVWADVSQKLGTWLKDGR